MGGSLSSSLVGSLVSHLLMGCLVLFVVYLMCGMLLVTGLVLLHSLLVVSLVLLVSLLVLGVVVLLLRVQVSSINGGAGVNEKLLPIVQVD